MQLFLPENHGSRAGKMTLCLRVLSPDPRIGRWQQVDVEPTGQSAFPDSVNFKFHERPCLRRIKQKDIKKEHLVSFSDLHIHI